MMEYVAPCGSTGQAPATERRKSPRSSAVANRAVLEWTEGSESRESPARLVDISGGGARLVAEGLPPLGQSVWFRLEQPAASGWVGARVVRHDDSHGAGLEFANTCPFDVYHAATLGISLDGVFERPDASGFQFRDGG